MALQYDCYVCRLQRWGSALAGCCIVTATASPAFAQELIGRRFFPDQLVISEPFVEDELSFPQFLYLRRPAATGTEVEAEIKKRLTSQLEASLSGMLINLHRDSTSATGFDNLRVGLKYQFLADADREIVASAALSWEVGGTGRRAVGAESFDTLHPAVLVGKGFGDLPDGFAALKPLAVATQLGAAIPVGAHQPDLLEWGVVIEFSLPYLSSLGRARSLPAVLKQTIPMVEMDFQTALTGSSSGTTSGTANIGAIWVGPGVQIALEAVVPINERSGEGVGVRGFVRFDLELLFGEWAGRPLFGPPPRSRRANGYGASHTVSS